MADRAARIPIVREAWPLVSGLGGAATLTGLLGLGVPAAVLGGATLFTGWFFRNPARRVPTLERAVVSPGDGRVVAVVRDELESRYLKAPTVRVSLFLNIFDVHVNRVPCSGTVEQVIYQPGRFLAANRAEAQLQNEQNAIMIRTPGGRRVLCVQVAGLIARRIVCWVKPGEEVVRGERYGLIRFGSRMDLYLPEDTVVHVSVGQRLRGGADLVGLLPEGA